MAGDQIEYFQIEVIGGEGFSANLHHQSAKDGLYISPSGRLCGPAAAMIEYHDIAERFAEALMPQMQKKFGASIKLEIKKTSLRASSYLLERDKQRIKEHTEKISNWLKRRKI